MHVVDDRIEAVRRSIEREVEKMKEPSPAQLVQQAAEITFNHAIRSFVILYGSEVTAERLANAARAIRVQSR